MGDYRKLDVYRRARALENRVYKLIEKMPARLQDALREQLGDAAKSIRRNICEGAGLNMDTLLAKHLRHALGSANEVQDELDDLNEKNLLPAEDQDLIGETTEIRSMIAAFLNKVLRDIERVGGPPARRQKQRPRRRR